MKHVYTTLCTTLHKQSKNNAYAKYFEGMTEDQRVQISQLIFDFMRWFNNYCQDESMKKYFASPAVDPFCGRDPVPSDYRSASFVNFCRVVYNTPELHKVLKVPHHTDKDSQEEEDDNVVL
jgi:hypothetical protein